MIIVIKDITPSPTGEEVLIKIDISDNGRIQHMKGEIVQDIYAEFNLPYSITEPLEINRDTCASLEYSMKLTDAIKAGINLIAFAQNTKKSMCQKLMVRGFSKEIAIDAADYIEKIGYINEYDMALSLIDDMSKNRLYGFLKIKNELFVKGIGTETIKKAFEDSSIDFVSLCVKRIEKMHDIPNLSDRQELMKFMASLNRAGFSVDEIKKALKTHAKK